MVNTSRHRTLYDPRPGCLRVYADRKITGSSVEILKIMSSNLTLSIIKSFFGVSLSGDGHKDELIAHTGRNWSSLGCHGKMSEAYLKEEQAVFSYGRSQDDWHPPGASLLEP